MAVSWIGVAAAPHLVGALVHLEVGEAEHPVVLGLVAGPAQDGVHPGDDLGQCEGLGDVVVAADGQAGQLVLQRVAGREEEDGHADPVGPQAPGHLDAVEVGQHHVEDHEVRRVAWAWASALPPGDRLVDREALVAERGRHRIDDGGLVVHHQDPRSTFVLHRMYLPRPHSVSPGLLHQVWTGCGLAVSAGRGASGPRSGRQARARHGSRPADRAPPRRVNTIVPWLRSPSGAGPGWAASLS